eukprot:gene9139-10113_t
MASSRRGEKVGDITTYIRKEFDSLTIHGLPRVFTSTNRVVKLFWLAVFLGLCGFVIQSIYANILLFNQYDVYIKTEVRPQKPMPFPAITFCNTNQYNGTSYMSLNISGMKCNENVNFSALKSEDEIIFHRACRLFLSGVNDTFKFETKELDAFPSYFAPSPNLFQCFTFNRINKLSQKIAHMTQGLQVLLYIDPDDYSTQDLKNNSRFDDIRRGMVILIHDPEVYDNLTPESTVLINPGESIDIALTKKIYRRKPAPYTSKCKTRETSAYKLAGEYTTPACMWACFHQKIKDRCGEYTPSTMTPKQAACTENVYKEMPLEDCDCPPPCTENVYHQTIARNPWPTHVHINLLHNDGRLKERLNISADTMTPAYLHQRFAQIRIYFSSLMVDEIIEKELYDRSKLLGDLGGLIGLAIGASIISLVELVWVGAVLAKKLVQNYLLSQHAVHAQDDSA